MRGLLINGPFQNKPFILKNIVANTSDGISNYFAQSIIKDNIIYSEYGGFASGTNTSAFICKQYNYLLILL